jgi:hypothetical protein
MLLTQQTEPRNYIARTSAAGGIFSLKMIPARAPCCFFSLRYPA